VSVIARYIHQGVFAQEKCEKLMGAGSWA